MAAAAVEPMYWCHQCNVQTRPIVGDDVVCSFCNGGFIEELENAELEPGLAFSNLPSSLTDFLRSPLPASVGIPTENNNSNPSATSSPSPLLQRNTSQSHRPRLLTGHISGVHALLEAMMHVVQESPLHLETQNVRISSRSPRDIDFGRSDAHAAVASHGQDSSNSENSTGNSDNSSNNEENLNTSPDSSNNQEQQASQTSPMLILHAGMPNGLRTLEVLVDHGLGFGPQLLPANFGDYFMGPDLDRLIQILAENDQNRYGTPPASKAEVEKLARFKVTKEHMQSETSQCAVCKDDFELDVEVLQMPCKHMYHPDCIMPWLSQHNSCPVCRFELPTDDPDYEARKNQAAGSTATASGAEGQTRNPGASNEHRNIDDQAQGTDATGPTHVRTVSIQIPTQFTLMGMPSFGFDPSMLAMLGSNDILRMMGRNARNESESTRNESEQSSSPESGRRDGAPIHWLFRLFSLSNSRNDSNNNDEQNQGSESESNSANT